ncbi:MAG: hypothetical protein Kow0059_08960 [Candidatus Sumerlaeia bacterium]
MWAPPQFSRLSVGYYGFVAAVVPMGAGAIYCRFTQDRRSDSGLLMFVLVLFFSWAVLSEEVSGRADLSIPIVWSNLAVTNLASLQTGLGGERAEEFRVAVYDFFSTSRAPHSLRLQERLISLSPLALAFFVFMFFTYLGYTLSRSAQVQLEDKADHQGLGED